MELEKEVEKMKKRVIVVVLIVSIGFGFVLGAFYEKSKQNVEKVDISPYAVFKKNSN